MTGSSSPAVDEGDESCSPSRPSNRARSALAVGLSASLLTIAALLLLAPVYHEFIDLHVYLVGGDALAADDPLYSVRGETGGWFTYPPFAAILFGPLAALPVGAAELLWLLLVTAATLLICLVAVPERTPRWLAGIAGLLVPWTVVLFNNLRFGQIGVLICLLVLADLGLLARRSPFAGALIGFVTAIKFTPALFVIWLVCIGRYRPAGVACGVFITAAGLGVLAAPEGSLTYWTEALWMTDRVGPIESTRNLSLFGALIRLDVAASMAFLAQTFTAVVGLAAAARLTQLHSMLAGACLVGLLTAVLSPIAWTHHFVWLIPVLLAALAHPSRQVPILALVTLVGITTGIGPLAGNAVLQLVAIGVAAAMIVIAFAPPASQGPSLPLHASLRSVKPGQDTLGDRGAAASMLPSRALLAAALRLPVIERD